MQNRKVNEKKLRHMAWEMGVIKAAAKAGVGSSTLDKIINGRYEGHSIKVDTMEKIASAFGVSIDEIFPVIGKKRNAS